MVDKKIMGLKASNLSHTLNKLKVQLHNLAQTHIYFIPVVMRF